MVIMFRTVRPKAYPYGPRVGNSSCQALGNSDYHFHIAHGFPLPEAATGPGEGFYPVAVEPHILVAWELRKLRGDLSQSEIAARLGIPYQSYQRLENPGKGNPTVKTLERVAKAFGKRLEIGLV